MEEITEGVNNIAIAEDAQKKNRIQVSNTKKQLFFYVNLAKCNTCYAGSHCSIFSSDCAADADRLSLSLIIKFERSYPCWELIREMMLEALRYCQ
ncbi:Alba DNA/RNA-binding protein [Perilla frutescens var. hirtella]|uniref:Alba DNA/RNA-binding protein n=1 Tax=Perilla frutescens var. hirtella TaxID=608512 RepID=A0AAD4JA12_PERFH|nr:Alba DNA/RNA-binding protein [Perilla frutescens var. hirtella]